MTEITLSEIQHRIEVCENDIKSLYSRANKSDVAQAETNTKLDNVLVTLGEVKESVNAIKLRPATMWDKLIFAIIGAAATAMVALILKGGM